MTTSQPVRRFRVLDLDGEPWFVANDVLAVLGMGRTATLFRQLTDAERGTASIADTSGGRVRKLSVISESALRRLILRSRTPEAAQFILWLFESVLPVLAGSAS